jgi:hypothetical protein
MELLVSYFNFSNFRLFSLSLAFVFGGTATKTRTPLRWHRLVPYNRYSTTVTTASITPSNQLPSSFLHQQRPIRICAPFSSRTVVVVVVVIVVLFIIPPI